MHKNIVIPLHCQCRLFIDTCVSKNLIVSKDLIFCIVWYNVVHWSSHIWKNSFVSFYSFLVKFSGGKDTIKLTVWQSPMGWKIPLCNWNTFWMALCLIYFIVILFYIERKWLLLRNLARILPLKSKLSGKFQCFNAIIGSIKMLKNSSTYKNFN